MYKIAAAGAAVTAVPLVIVLLAASILASVQPGGNSGLGAKPTPLARQDIPADYLAWYSAAARTCPGLPWLVLAGIGKVESNHGRSRLPGVRTGANSAGAEGPMQFLPATFAKFAVNADPRHRLTPYDPLDAIYTAARMLCANGARGGTDVGIQTSAYSRRSSPTTTPPGTSPTSSPGLSGTPRQQPPAASRRPSPSPRRSSASPTAGAARAPAASIAAASSSPPTPPAASASPAPPSAGSKTARRFPCPSCSPATCCSPPALTAPPPARATSSCTSAAARSSRPR